MAIPLHINTAMGHILVIEKNSEDIGHFEYRIWSLLPHRTGHGF